MGVQVTGDADFKTTVESGEKAIIKFYADWCGSCKLIAPKYRRLSEDERFKDISFLDVNAESNPEIRQWAGVSNLPFFATVKDGKIVRADMTSKVENVEKMLLELS